MRARWEKDRRPLPLTPTSRARPRLSLANWGARRCKRVDIVSHGDANGKVDLPYKTGGEDSDKLGGRPASYGPDLNPKLLNADQKRLAKFLDSMKAAACPEKPAVHFQGCWSGSGGSSIAAE